MKIAVPTKGDNRVDDHFGHCEFYKIFSISESNEIEDEVILQSPQGCGCKSNIASDLAEMGVEIMLAGGIGNGAIQKLASQGIQVVRNCQGDVNSLVSEYLKGNIKDGGASCKAHEEHSHADGHVCNH